MQNILLKSVLSGVFISIGGVVNLKIGGYFGAFLFSFGLLSVIHYSLPLFTGRAGFCKYPQDIKQLPIILLSNIFGTILIALPTHLVYPDLVPQAIEIVQSRYTSDLFSAFYKSFLCGLIMTTIVTFAKKGKVVPLLIGIPLFILSGFWHSIADSFYYSLALIPDTSLLYIYPVTVVGNFVGCNLYNLFSTKSLYQP